MRIRQTIPKQTEPVSNTTSMDEIKQLVEEIAEGEEQIQLLKDVTEVKSKRDRLKELMRSMITIDEYTKEHYVFVDDSLAARLFYRTGRVNVDVEELRKLVPASVFEKVTKKSEPSLVLEVGPPKTFDKRRATYNRPVEE